VSLVLQEIFGQYLINEISLPKNVEIKGLCAYDRYVCRLTILFNPIFLIVLKFILTQ
jgi:hypothetical protein